MTVVGFTSFYPPARYDSTPWTQVRIEQATSSSGPFSAVETLSIPVDPTPASPNAVNVTTDLATADYFRLVFLDANGDESFPSDVIDRSSTARVSAPNPEAISPSIDDVSAMLYGRITVGSTVFDADTNPTDLQVQRLIDHNAAEIFARCESISEKQIGFARHVVAIAVCVAIERGFFPQEQGNTDSPLDALESEYSTKIVRLENVCKLASSRVMP